MHASTTEYKEIEKRISDAEYTIESIDSTVKENAKCQKLLTPNIQKVQNKLRRPNLRIIGIEDFQLKCLQQITNEIFSNLKKEMSMNIKEA